MNYKIILASLVFLLCTLSTNAAMHKCTNSNGQVKYQDKPCDLKKEKSETIKTQKHEPPIKKANDRHKKFLSYFTATENHKAIVRSCDDENLTQAYNRYIEINQSKIKQGKAIYKRGFVGLPTSELRSIMKKTQNKARAELSKASDKEKSNICGAYEAKLRISTAASRKLKNGGYDDNFGYQEGDLDPEGND